MWDPCQTKADSREQGGNNGVVLCRYLYSDTLLPVVPEYRTAREACWSALKAVTVCDWCSSANPEALLVADEVP